MPGFRYACFLVALALPLAAEKAPTTPVPGSVTILVDYENTPNPESVRAMENEVREAFEGKGVRIGWRDFKAAVDGEQSADLVVFRFHGNCRMEAMPVVFDERGPYAFTHTMDGRIQPFSEVHCDRVRFSVSASLWGGQNARRNEYYGRALGRVVTHELYHILGSTHSHGSRGVTKAGLTGEDLTRERLDFHDDGHLEGNRAKE